MTEIEYLRRHLASSGCEFNRNGSWHAADEALRHIDRKYAFVLDKGMVGTAEDFIRLAASQSSVSGRPYLVRCGSYTPVASSLWLEQALAAFRHRAP